MNTQVYLAYDFPLLSVLWTMLGFALWVLWFFLLFKIIFDIFRDDSLGGWGKAGWLALVILLPFLGVFVYLIARGKGMGQRELDQARAQRKEFDSYVREAAAPASSADQLAKLSDLRARGDITDEEFLQAKALVLSGTAPESHATSITGLTGDDERQR
ncbi:SHOCT domain-containing protein [Streptomyces goshikiensis]|uniref:SHOCT domain-containing protein n=1 Tax=Streptomyces goshikiensis TaxID=1942 RepID=UPI00365B4C54